MKGTVKKIWNIITTILVVIIVILAILMAGVRLFGYNVFTILSGSMEPTYHVGSIIYVKDVDYRELKVGDPITFMLNEDTLATHRIVEIVPDEEEPETLRYKTKGDANEDVDGGLVHYKNIVGKPVFTIPYLGYISDFIQNPPGTYIAIAFAAVLLALVFIPDLLDDDKNEKKRKKSEDLVLIGDEKAEEVEGTLENLKNLKFPGEE